MRAGFPAIAVACVLLSPMPVWLPHTVAADRETSVPTGVGGASGPHPSAPEEAEEEFGDYSPVRVGKSRYSWDWLVSRFDQDTDGRVSRSELNLNRRSFAELDLNWDGVLTSEDFDWSPEGRLCRQKETTFALFKSLDRDSDGHLNKQELEQFTSKSLAEKGTVTEEELERLIFLPQVLKARAEYRSRASHAKFQSDDEGRLPTDLPEPGELAPDFVLPSPDQKQSISLASFRGQKPVVLIFGCLTCGNYRTYSETLEAMYERWHDKVEFLRVYVREAHPSDTHAPTPTNAKAGILLEQPVTLEQRCQAAARCLTDLDIHTPMVVDGMDNRIGKLYGGWPDRLYLIDREGNVVYQGGPGPFAFNPRELQQNLWMMMLDEGRGQPADGVSPK